ncbi:MAG TPA: hypothetical protein VKY81_01515 [Natronosporangium sp.]|nr:hypothetical protein [Natronosporangium sp.]
MINYILAVVIGAVIGVIGGFVLRGKNPNAMWMAPVAGVVGGVVASVLASLFGDPGYGWQEPLAQIVFAAAGVGVVAFLGSRQKAEAAAK